MILAKSLWFQTSFNVSVNERPKKWQNSDQKLREFSLKLINYFREWEIIGVKLKVPGFVEVTLNKKKKKQLAGVY